MSRYVKPTSNVVLRKFDKFASLDEGAGLGITVFGVVVSTFAFGMLADFVNLLFLVGFIPITYILVMWVVWFLATKKIGGYRGDDQLDSAIRAYDETRGAFEQTYAKPLVEQVWKHAQQGHEGGKFSDRNNRYYDVDCDICDDRVKALQKLRPVPQLELSRNEIETALEFVKERDKLLDRKSINA